MVLTIENTKTAGARTFDFGLKFCAIGVLDRFNDYYDTHKTDYAGFISDVELGFQQTTEEYLRPLEAFVASAHSEKQYAISPKFAYFHGFGVESGSSVTKMQIAVAFTAALYTGVATYPSFEDGLVRISTTFEEKILPYLQNEYYVKMVQHKINSKELRESKPDLSTREFMKELRGMDSNFKQLVGLEGFEERKQQYTQCFWEPHDGRELERATIEYLDRIETEKQ